MKDIRLTKEVDKYNNNYKELENDFLSVHYKISQLEDRNALTNEILKKYAYDLITRAKGFIEEFKIICEKERKNIVNTYRYDQLYSIYRELTSLEILWDLNAIDCKAIYNDTIIEFQEAIIDWKRKHPEHTEYINNIDFSITDILLDSFLQYYSNYNHYRNSTYSNIIKDMKIESLYNLDDDVNYVYLYMFYYLLPKYVDDESIKVVFEKVSKAMLEELDPFVDDIIKLDIEEAANDYLIDKEMKKGPKK